MALTDISLTLRDPTNRTTPLTATEHDNNLTAIQNAVNALNAEVNKSLTYGEMYQGYSTSAVSITTAGTYEKVGSFSAGNLSSNVTFDNTDQSLTVNEAGIYMIYASFSLQGTVGSTYAFTFAVNNPSTGALTDHAVQRKTASGDIDAASVVAVHSLSAGDKIYFVTTDVGTTSTVTVSRCTVALHRLGG